MHGKALEESRKTKLGLQPSGKEDDREEHYLKESKVLEVDEVIAVKGVNYHLCRGHIHMGRNGFYYACAELREDLSVDEGRGENGWCSHRLQGHSTREEALAYLELIVPQVMNQRY